MGFMDGLRGRRKPVRPNLDSLFAIPSAAITLQVSLDYLSTGEGAVAFRPAEGRAFADVEAEIRALLDADEGPPIRVVSDHFGYTWIVVTTDPPDVGAVVTDLHAVNVTLSDHGFGPQLLCSLVPFQDPRGTRMALIYLYKRGTFYPCAGILSWNCRSATCCVGNFPGRRICHGGSRCGMPPACRIPTSPTSPTSPACRSANPSRRLRGVPACGQVPPAPTSLTRPQR